MGKLGRLFKCCANNDAAVDGGGGRDVRSNGGGAAASRAVQGALANGNGRRRSDKHVTIQESGFRPHRGPQSPPVAAAVDQEWSAGSQASGRSSVYFDASEGASGDSSDDVWADSLDVTLQIDGQFFFSAKDDPTLTAEAFEGIKMYPPLPTTEPDPIPRSPITTSNMQTLLHTYQHEGDGVDSTREAEEADAAAARMGAALEGQARRMTLKESRELTTEYLGESTNQLLKDLKTTNIREKGFPGELTEEELEAVKRFKSELEARDPIYKQIVHALSSVEKEAYALCRFLRARKFDVDKVFELLDEAKEFYAKAKEFDFYPDLEPVLGFSRPIFLSQYPSVWSGNAKNGCPVMYLRCGEIQPDGIKCIVSVENIDKFFWNDITYTFPPILKEGKNINPNFARTESITVYDLKGVSRSQINSDTFEVIKRGIQVMGSFPETLHCLLIINAPSWFGLIWSVVRKILDPRTASKIEVFSSAKGGDRRMRELIDPSQIPSNYEGGGPSLAEAASAGAPGSSSSRGASKMVVLNRLLTMTKRKPEASHGFELGGGKQMTLVVYTRCRAGATAELVRADTEATVTKIDIVGGDEDKPYSRTIGALVGPGSFTVKLKLMSDPGVFLLLGTACKGGDSSSFSLRQVGSS